MVSLSAKIEQYVNAPVDFLSEVILQDNRDGNGAYIQEWNLDIPQPTQEQLDALESDVLMKLLRSERNQRLANTDWWASSDLTMTQEQIDYRQALRDITETYTSLDDVVWPELP